MSKAPQGGIEPNSVLIFDVDLLKVNPPADAAQPAAADIQAQLQQQIESMQSASPTCPIGWVGVR